MAIILGVVLLGAFTTSQPKCFSSTRRSYGLVCWVSTRNLLWKPNCFCKSRHLSFQDLASDLSPSSNWGMDGSRNASYGTGFLWTNRLTAVGSSSSRGPSSSFLVYRWHYLSRFCLPQVKVCGAGILFVKFPLLELTPWLRSLVTDSDGPPDPEYDWGCMHC